MCSTQNSTGGRREDDAPAHSIGQGDMGSNCPRSPHWQTCPAAGPPGASRTSSCACSNSKTCKHIVTLLGRKSTQEVHGQRELALATGSNTQETSALKLGEQRNGNTTWGLRAAHTRMLTRAHMAPGGSRFHQWPSSRAAPRLAQNFICCNLLPATLLLLRHKHSYSSIYLPSSENHAEPFSLDQRTGAAGPLWLYASLCRCGQGSPPPARWGHRRPKW